MAQNKTLLLTSTALAAVLFLTACEQGSGFYRQAGAEVDEGGFGNPTMTNMLVQTGRLEATHALQNRFAAEVDSTINFAFNSAALTEEAQATLRQQASWIRQFPEVRFKVFGHTDLVGSDAYNKGLGMRRARAAVNYLAAQGIGSARLEAVVSFGKTQPVVQTPGPEERNRRTVTEVAGFTRHPNVLNGKYAEIVWRTYVNKGSDTSLAERPHPLNSSISTQVNPNGG